METKEIKEKRETRDSFVFYRSFEKAISMSELEDSQQLEIYRMISQYALDGIMPEGHGITMAIFTLIQPQIDANYRKYENGKKNRGNKSKTGEPAGGFDDEAGEAN